MLHSLKRSSHRFARKKWDEPVALLGQICASRYYAGTYKAPPLFAPTIKPYVPVSQPFLSSGSRVLAQHTLEEFNSKLSVAVNFDSKPSRVFELVAEMKSNGVKPDLATYHRLMNTCARACLGVEAWAVLNDMFAVGINPDAYIFDLLIAAQGQSDTSEVWKVVAKMEEIGMKLRPTTYHEITKRFVADENLEMTLQVLKMMSSEKQTPTSEIMVSIISLAADLGHPRLALDLVASAEAALKNLPPEVWVLCLQSSARELYAEGTLHAWNKVVHDLQLMLDEGTCLTVLTTAARSGLPDLARSVIRTLKSLYIDLQEHHLAPLVQAYCTGGDAFIEDAILSLNEIRREGIIPTQRTAAPIFSLVEGDPDAIDRVWSVVEDLKSRGKTVETSVPNALIHASAELADIPRAMMIYRAIPTLDATIDTFNSLLRACVLSSRRELADRVLADMRTACVRSNADTFRHMTMLCLTQDIYEDAFYYLEETKTAGFNPDITIYEALARRCAEEGDGRLRLVLEEMAERKMEVTPRLEKDMKDAKFEREGREREPVRDFVQMDEEARRAIEEGGLV